MSYIDPENLSTLQKIFGVATSPEIMVVVSIIAIIAFVGVIYLALGFIIFLFLNKE